MKKHRPLHEIDTLTVHRVRVKGGKCAGKCFLVFRFKSRRYGRIFHFGGIGKQARRKRRPINLTIC